MSKDLLKSFQEAYRNLELLPLSQQKDLNQFRVDYGGDTIDELEQLVEDSPSSDGKIIFTGHRGCGKSTLLAEFSRHIQGKYFVVFFSIAQTIEMGVLRELIRIANECCRICLRLIRRQTHENIMINLDILGEAINNIRNDFALPLGSKEYKILETTYKNFKPEDPKEQEFLDLLHGLYILEYRNHKNWYDVHPIVVELLRDEALI